jgi:RNA polymerase sigma-32 factor
MELLSLMREHLVEFRETLAADSKELVIFDKRLVAEDPLTLQEIGDSYGISRERVRQLEQRVTSKLRTFLIERVGEVAEDDP